jgi:hypothetical protein
MRSCFSVVAAQPRFTATPMVSLALGLALTASTLAVVNGYVVRAMPSPESERLANDA